VFDTVGVSGNKLKGNGASDLPLFTVSPTKYLETNDGPNLGLFSLRQAAWNGEHFKMGAYHFWVDSSDRLRIKPSAPSSDVDGVVVGTQV
jgi:hypothetical protein